MDVSKKTCTKAGGRLVTIGVPIYKRLQYLPHVLELVAAQDYPFIELLVSDNGQNGSVVSDMVRKLYPRPYRFRQNPATVDITTHTNQIMREATGEYYLFLCDDDEISPTFISALVEQLDQHPEAALAYGRQEIIDAQGTVLRRSKENFPEKMTGLEFVRSTWQKYEFGFENVESCLFRTKPFRDFGGYPAFTKGNHTDDAAIVRLCLHHDVVFSPKCCYRHRIDPDSYGRAVSLKELADASK
jgi:glycosyltransferase involved in cell wall biosynthesis